MTKNFKLQTAVWSVLVLPALAQAAPVTITSLTYFHNAIPNCEDTVFASPCAPVGVTAAGATDNPFLNDLDTKAIDLGFGSYYTFGNPFAGTDFMIPGGSISAIIGLSDGTTLTGTTVVPDLSMAGLGLFSFSSANISIAATGITDADRMSFGYPPGAFAPDGNLDYVLKLTYAPPAGAPEPGAWALMILGMGLVGCALRRKALAA